MKAVSMYPPHSHSVQPQSDLLASELKALLNGTSVVVIREEQGLPFTFQPRFTSCRSGGLNQRPSGHKLDFVGFFCLFFFCRFGSEVQIISTKSKVYRVQQKIKIQLVTKFSFPNPSRVNPPPKQINKGSLKKKINPT